MSASQRACVLAAMAMILLAGGIVWENTRLRQNSVQQTLERMNREVDAAKAAASSAAVSAAQAKDAARRAWKGVPGGS